MRLCCVGVIASRPIASALRAFNAIRTSVPAPERDEVDPAAFNLEPAREDAIALEAKEPHRSCFGAEAEPEGGAALGGVAHEALLRRSAAISTARA